MNDPELTALVDAAGNGDRRALARLLSRIERRDASVAELAATIAAKTGNAQLVGVTGAPGVGKSTCVSALTTSWRETGLTVGVVAVDPSSPFSGGALLGDRVRMQHHAGDAGVFIRSMASRGQLGGVSAAVPDALRLLDAVGFGVVITETVGVGQAEVDIATLADTTVVMLAPGMGDGVQSVKAGILEIADIYVVNKADREGAQNTVRDLKNLLALGGRHSEAGSWRPRIVSTVASRGEGMTELCAAVAEHREWLERSGELTRRRTARAAAHIQAVVLARLTERTSGSTRGETLAELAADVARAKSDPYTAATRLLEAGR